MTFVLALIGTAAEMCIGFALSDVGGMRIWDVICAGGCIGLLIAAAIDKAKRDQ